MAGNYPDVPAPRLPYDLDGSVLFFHDIASGSVTLQANTVAQALNKETGGAGAMSYNSGSRYRGIIFPSPRTIEAYFIQLVGNTYQWGYGAMQVSADTTNGLDGTWTTIESNWGFNANISTYRTAIRSISGATNIIAMRFLASPGGGSVSNTWGAFHLYGTWLPTGEYVRFWHPTLDQPLGGADLDFGDVRQGTSSTKSFRLKNISASMTAIDTVVSDEAPTDFTPSLPPQYDYSIDGGVNYAQAPTIPSIAPGAISGVITVRRTTPANAALSVHVLRVRATPTSWA